MGNFQLQYQFCLDIRASLRELVLEIGQARNNPQLFVLMLTSRIDPQEPCGGYIHGKKAYIKG